MLFRAKKNELVDENYLNCSQLEQETQDLESKISEHLNSAFNKIKNARYIDQDVQEILYGYFNANGKLKSDSFEMMQSLFDEVNHHYENAQTNCCEKIARFFCIVVLLVLSQGKGNINIPLEDNVVKEISGIHSDVVKAFEYFNQRERAELCGKYKLI